MKKIGIGRTAEVFLDGDGAAVKLFYDWMPQAAAEHEAQILRDVSGACPLAPRFHALCEAEGRHGFRFEFIPGSMLGEIMLQRPLALTGCCRAMGKVHREIHRCSVAGLQTAEQIYSSAIRDCNALDAECKDKLLGFIRSGSGGSLCHGDFHPENVLVENEGRMRVIDWVNAYSGDPLSDVARTYYLIRYGKSPNRRTALQSAAEEVLKPLAAKAYLRGYFAGRKFPKEEFRRWLFAVMVRRDAEERIPEEEPCLKKAIAKARLKIF